MCQSLCVCVCYHSNGRTDRHTDFNFGMVVKWKNIEVKFRGQGHRSKVNVMRSKNVGEVVSLTFESLFNGPAKEETQEYDVGCFQSICVFYNNIISCHTMGCVT